LTGFHPRYKTLPYATLDATDLAWRLTGLLGRTPVHEFAGRGLDRGAFIPLMAMYPTADVPAVQLSMPSLDPSALLGLGARLRPLRDEGVLVLGSGFMTHSFAVFHRPELAADTTAFDAWAVPGPGRRRCPHQLPRQGTRRRGRPSDSRPFRPAAAHRRRRRRPRQRPERHRPHGAGQLHPLGAADLSISMCLTFLTDRLVPW
jgi:hypothetical protein